MKKLWIVYFLLIVCASCTSQPAEAELVLPTRIHTPTQTATPLPTATPTALVLADHGGQTEPYPDLEVITAENVHRLEEVDMWGKGTVMGIALSPDASTIAVSTATGIYFYDANTMKQIDWIDFAIAQIDTALMHPNWTYDNLDYSPDGKSLVVGFDDLYIVDLDTKMITQFDMTETEMYRPYVMETTYSKDGQHILVNRASEQYGFREMLFEIYELKSNRVVFDYEFKLFDSSARIYLVDEGEAAIDQILVDIDTGEIIRKESPTISGAEEQTIIFEQLAEDQWRISLPQKNLSCDFFEKCGWYDMTDFSEDQLTWIVRRGDSSELNVFRFDSCQKSEQSLFFTEAFGKFNISGQGNFVSTGNNLGNYQSLWDVHTGEVVVFQETDGLVFDGYESKLYSINDSLPWEENSTEPVIKDVFTGETIIQIGESPLDQFIINPIDSDIFFLNDNLINVSHTNQTVKQYGEYPYQFSPDGKYVVYLVKQSKHPYAFLYFDSVFTGELVPTETITILLPSASKLDNTEIEDFQLSNTERYVIFSGKDEHLVWDLVDEKPVLIHNETEDGYMLNMTFSSDDELLFVREAPYGSGKISVFDLKTEQVIYDFIPPKILSLGPVISPDGKFMAFLGYDGTIRIYGVKSETK